MDSQENIRKCISDLYYIKKQKCPFLIQYIYIFDCWHAISDVLHEMDTPTLHTISPFLVMSLQVYHQIQELKENI